MHVYVCVCCCSWRCISLFFIQLHKARTQFVARLLLIFCYTISVKLHKPCQNDLWTLERIEQTNFMHKCINRRNQMAHSQTNNNFNRRHCNNHTYAMHRSYDEKHSTNIKLKQNIMQFSNGSNTHSNRCWSMNWKMYTAFFLFWGFLDFVFTIDFFFIRWCLK